MSFFRKKGKKQSIHSQFQQNKHSLTFQNSIINVKSTSSKQSFDEILKLIDVQNETIVASDKKQYTKKLVQQAFFCKNYNDKAITQTSNNKNCTFLKQKQKKQSQQNPSKNLKISHNHHRTKSSTYNFSSYWKQKAVQYQEKYFALDRENSILKQRISKMSQENKILNNIIEFSRQNQKNIYEKEKYQMHKIEINCFLLKIGQLNLILQQKNILIARQSKQIEELSKTLIEKQNNLQILNNLEKHIPEYINKEKYSETQAQQTTQTELIFSKSQRPTIQSHEKRTKYRVNTLMREEQIKKTNQSNHKNLL